MNRYRVLLPLLVNGEHGQGDEFDHEFNADDEATNLDSGLLAIVPREYRVLVGEVYETETGGTFAAALRIGQEAHLLDGGFIERVEPKKAAAKGKEK